MRFRVEKLKRGIALSEFNDELTFFHSEVACQEPAWFEKVFGWIDRLRELGRLNGKLLQLRGQLFPQVRLHTDRVLLLHRIGPLRNTGDDAGWLNDWVTQQGFRQIDQLQWSHTLSPSPVEDGFFQCVRAVSTANPESNRCHECDTLDWRHFLTPQGSIGGALAGFMASELQRIGSHAGHFLDAWYARQGMNRITKFFDTEYAYLEFAAAVVSACEMRFWSRPVQYPK